MGFNKPKANQEKPVTETKTAADFLSL